MPWIHRTDVLLETEESRTSLVWTDDEGEIVLPPRAVEELTALLSREEKQASPLPSPAPSSAEDFRAAVLADREIVGIGIPELPPARSATAQPVAMDFTASGGFPKLEGGSIFKAAEDDEEE